MSILNTQQEDIVCKWIAAEALYFLKDRHIENREDWINTFKTRVHKIIFNIAEENDLNITRSWYLHGAFIHEYRFENDFSSLARSYVSTTMGPVRLQSKVIGILGDVGSIVEDIQRIANEIDSLSVDEYLSKFYREEAPEPFRDAYLSKFRLTSSDSVLNLLGGAYRYNSMYLNVILDNIDRIHDDITDFQSAVFSFNNEDILDQNTLLYFNVLEDSIRKLELWHKYEAAESFSAFSFFDDAKKFFVDYVWKPYACEITKSTVKGLRKTNVRSRAQTWKRETLNQYNYRIQVLEQKKNQMGMRMDYEEMKEYIGSLDKDDEKLLKLISTYDKIKE